MLANVENLFHRECDLTFFPELSVLDDEVGDGVAVGLGDEGG